MTCCFCGKELAKRMDAHNPEPMWYHTEHVCCLDCDKKFVIPIRQILWKPWVTKEDEAEFVRRFKLMSTGALYKLLHESSVDNPDDYKQFREKVFNQHVYWVDNAKRKGEHLLILRQNHRL